MFLKRVLTELASEVGVSSAPVAEVRTDMRDVRFFCLGVALTLLSGDTTSASANCFRSFLLRKLRPRIDFRPLFSLGSFPDSSGLLLVAFCEACEADDPLRAKKGMPDETPSDFLADSDVREMPDWFAVAAVSVLSKLLFLEREPRRDEDPLAMVARDGE